MSHEGIEADAAGQDQVVMEATRLEEPVVPNRILIAPWGVVKSTAGSFVVDEQSAAAAITAFREHAIDLPIDYEHQTLGGSYSSPTGLAPAAGWIKSLHCVTPQDAQANDANTVPGIWADVQWTPEAVEKLSSRQYRYLSPVALVRRSDRRLVALHSVALTNKPAIIGMKPVVNRDESAVPQVESSPDDELRRLLCLDESATEDLVLIAAAQRIRGLQAQESRQRALDRVERAALAGKLTASQRDWALAFAERDPQEFDRWEAGAPRVIYIGRLTPPPRAEADVSLRRRSMAHAARAEWRAHRALLERICTEEAYVAAAARDADN